jgi:transposase
MLSCFPFHDTGQLGWSRRLVPAARALPLGRSNEGGREQCRLLAHQYGPAARCKPKVMIRSGWSCASVSGPLMEPLWTELNKLGLPVICIDARHAKAALKMQINKSDRNDAVGIARIMQCGWYKEVRVKDLDSHAIKALLVSRALLVKIKRDLENQIRGLLKNLGLVIGRAKMNVFAARAAELIQDRPELTAAVAPLLKTREVIERQIADLNRKVLRLARNNTQVRRFMTVPGVGPNIALCYLATIDDPSRFKKSRSVGAYAVSIR